MAGAYFAPKGRIQKLLVGPEDEKHRFSDEDFR